LFNPIDFIMIELQKVITLLLLLSYQNNDTDKIVIPTRLCTHDSHHDPFLHVHHDGFDLYRCQVSLGDTLQN
jgi:hypothetical protein